MQAELPRPHACLHVLQNFFLCSSADGTPRPQLLGGASGGESPLGRKRGEVEYYTTCFWMVLANVKREVVALPLATRVAYAKAAGRYTH